MFSLIAEKYLYDIKSIYNQQTKAGDRDVIIHHNISTINGKPLALQDKHKYRIIIIAI